MKAAIPLSTERWQYTGRLVQSKIKWFVTWLLIILTLELFLSIKLEHKHFEM